MEAAFLEVASRVEADMVVEGIKRHTRNSLESKVQSPKSEGRQWDYGTTGPLTTGPCREKQKGNEGEKVKR